MLHGSSPLSRRVTGSVVGAVLAVACGSDEGNTEGTALLQGTGGATAAGGVGGTAPAASGGLGGAVTGAGGVASAAGGAANASGGAANGGTSPGTGGVGGAASNGGASAGSGGAGAGGTGAPGFDHDLLGVYCGNSPSDITQFETWLGHPVDGILGYTGNASWEDYDGSVGWATGVWSALDRRVLWSVPLIPNGANLADAAAGKYDDHYTKAAKTLAGYRTQEKILYVRTGWEFNGDWFPWKAKGQAQNFAGAFQHFVAAFRAVSPRFKFEWNVNVGDVGMNPEDAYPGDASVDIVGMDFYWNTQWDPKDATAAWDSMMNRKWGLKWHQEFAAAHGKPTAYSEWGIMSNDAAAYIQQAKTWFASHDVVYQTYWNSDNAFTGKLSSGQYPAAGTAYKAAFPD